MWPWFSRKKNPQDYDYEHIQSRIGISIKKLAEKKITLQWRGGYIHGKQ